MRRERDRMAAEMAGLENAPAGGVDGNVKEAVDRLWNLAEELGKAPPARLRELVRRMVRRIDLWFDKKRVGPRFVCPLLTGIIDLRPDPSFYRLDSRGDRI